MQTKEPEGHARASGEATDASTRLLENPNRLVVGDDPGTIRVYADGMHTATLEGQFNTLVMRSDAPPFAGTIFDFNLLRWTMNGAMARIQGAHVLDILGHTLVVLRGKHRDVWHPQPGMDEIRVLVPIDNPKGLRPLEVFQLAMRLGF
jgi:hypothetical protein